MAPDEIDLAGGPVPHFLRDPYSPVRKQESVRSWVTGALVGALVILIGFAGFVAARGSKDQWEQTKEMLQIMLPAVTGLLGSALGFYFGAQSRKDP